MILGIILGLLIGVCGIGVTLIISGNGQKSYGKVYTGFGIIIASLVISVIIITFAMINEKDNVESVTPPSINEQVIPNEEQTPNNNITEEPQNEYEDSRITAMKNTVIDDNSGLTWGSAITFIENQQWEIVEATGGDVAYHVTVTGTFVDEELGALPVVLEFTYTLDEAISYADIRVLHMTIADIEYSAQETLDIINEIILEYNNYINNLQYNL